jgi:hypothetical protein
MSLNILIHCSMFIFMGVGTELGGGGGRGLSRGGHHGETINFPRANSPPHSQRENSGGNF